MFYISCMYAYMTLNIDTKDVKRPQRIPTKKPYAKIKQDLGTGMC